MTYEFTHLPHPDTPTVSTLCRMAFSAYEGPVEDNYSDIPTCPDCARHVILRGVYGGDNPDILFYYHLLTVGHEL